MITEGDACPRNFKQSLCLYRDHHVRCGDFLRSVLAGDLHMAARRADSDSRFVLHEITCFVLANLPDDAIGSWQKVEAWENAK